MATECTAYRDSKGTLHSSLEKATLEDLAAVLGRVGDEGGMTSGVARMIFDKRSEIERVFAEHDALVKSAAGREPFGSIRNIHVIKSDVH
ncbi:hypothetical protein [Novosphingobium sp. TCA1]|uniref:hypothetical protein n=1 Tax=Novosphingobium sp. TCA1 TaxID=2682474 RepID=UPI001307957E|nr:hypothetical protein [Novosphingobium sp. TCA1]GFE77646.1 hypothetical protein NTCA1_52950 [Novosphingobium sp. TCA1]